jgi:hypothetical protein
MPIKLRIRHLPLIKIPRSESFLLRKLQVEGNYKIYSQRWNWKITLRIPLVLIMQFVGLGITVI